MFVVRGSSSTANVKDVQFRVLLRADDAGNAPEVFGLNFTYKKSSYSANEAVYTGKTSAGALPKSASVDITATSAYAYHLTRSIVAFRGSKVTQCYHKRILFIYVCFRLIDKRGNAIVLLVIISDCNPSEKPLIPNVFFDSKYAVERLNLLYTLYFAYSSLNRFIFRHLPHPIVFP